MTYNDYIFKNFYNKICSIVESSLKKINSIKAIGSLKSANIDEYKHKDGIYIYIIREVGNKNFEVVITASEQIKNMKRYIEGFQLLASAVEGSYIAFEDKENKPQTINFRLNNANDEAIQGKLTARQNSSIDSTRTITIYQDIEQSTDNPVKSLIQGLIKEYIALQNMYRYMESILYSTGEINPDILKSFENTYSSYEPDIIGLVSGAGRWTIDDRH